jgi:hypothetical protein
METTEFNLVKDAVKTGIAPAEIAVVFNELTALRRLELQIQKPGFFNPGVTVQFSKRYQLSR